MWWKWACPVHREASGAQDHPEGRAHGGRGPVVPELPAKPSPQPTRQPNTAGWITLVRPAERPSQPTEEQKATHYCYVTPLYLGVACYTAMHHWDTSQSLCVEWIRERMDVWHSQKMQYDPRSNRCLESPPPPNKVRPSHFLAIKPTMTPSCPWNWLSISLWPTSLPSLLSSLLPPWDSPATLDSFLFPLRAWLMHLCSSQSVPLTEASTNARDILKFYCHDRGAGLLDNILQGAGPSCRVPHGWSTHSWRWKTY